MGRQHRSLRSRRIEVGGYSLHARVARCRSATGTPPLVLVHGLGVSTRYMVPLARRLALHFDVYAVDLPGFGRSEKPPHVLTIKELSEVLGHFVERMDLRRAVFVGNSLGCEIIVELGLKRPDKIAGAVLQGPTIDPDRRTAAQQVLRLALDSFLEPITLIPIVVCDYLIAGPRRIVRTFRYMLDHRMEERLPHFRPPVVVVRGARDPVVTQRWVEEAAGLVPDGRLVVVPEVAHAANYARPGRLVEIIASFVREKQL